MYDQAASDTLDVSNRYLDTTETETIVVGADGTVEASIEETKITSITMSTVSLLNVEVFEYIVDMSRLQKALSLKLASEQTTIKIKVHNDSRLEVHLEVKTGSWESDGPLKLVVVARVCMCFHLSLVGVG